MTIIAEPLRIYQGDFREVFRNPVALVVAIVGTILFVGVALLAAFVFRDRCLEEFNANWEAQGRTRFNEAFLAAAKLECDSTSAEDPCVLALEKKWIAGGDTLYALDYQLLVTEACPAETDSDEFDIEFDPGTLVKLGVEIEEQELPEKIIMQDTRPEEETVTETVTEDEKAEVPEEPPPPKEEEQKKPERPQPRPQTPPDRKLPTSPTPTQKNTPYNDLPTVTQQKGDPFGDARGWSDLRRDGDKWATDVMAALNNMSVGAYAARGAGGDYRFAITLCKDGSVQAVHNQGGSMDEEGRQAVRLALQRLSLPRPPPEVASKMRGNCQRIRYTFRWSAGAVQ